jgi:hypothetical protein
MLATAGALTACNGNLFGNQYGNGYGYGGYGGYSPPPPITQPNCGKPPYNLTVLYPKPNAKDVSPSVRGVWVATSQLFPTGNQYDLVVQQTNGYQQNTGKFHKRVSPIPTPHASVPPGYIVYAAGFFYGIGSHQTVNLYWNNPATNCSPNVVVSSFTTK